MKKPKTEITVTELSVLAGADRHRCRQALADLEPVRTKGAVKYFNRGDALTALEAFSKKQSGRTAPEPQKNVLRILANVTVSRFFEFIGEDKFCLPWLPALAKDLGIDKVKAEKLSVQLWSLMAIRAGKFLEEQWLDNALKTDGTNLDDLYQTWFGCEPLPWVSQKANIQIPEHFLRLIERHGDVETVGPKEDE